MDKDTHKQGAGGLAHYTNMSESCVNPALPSAGRVFLSSPFHPPRNHGLSLASIQVLSEDWQILWVLDGLLVPKVVIAWVYGLLARVRGAKGFRQCLPSSSSQQNIDRAPVVCQACARPWGYINKQNKPRPSQPGELEEAAF